MLTCRGRSHGRGMAEIVYEWKRLKAAQLSNISLATSDESGRAVDFVERLQLLDSSRVGSCARHNKCFRRTA